MKSTKLFKISLTGIFAAAIALLTAFIKIPFGANGGYIHLGDSIIYLAACILGPYGIAAGAIGGALADILAGSAVWAIPSAVIKAANCLPFLLMRRFYKKKEPKIITGLSLTMAVVSGIITILGYFLAESLMYSFATAIPSIPFNAVQAVGSEAAFAAIGAALDVAKIKQLTAIMKK